MSKADITNGEQNGGWQKAVKNVQLGMKVSKCFQTLRDMYGHVILDENRIHVVKTLGAGQFGRVLKCTYGDYTIALKFLKQEFKNTQEEAVFLKEVEILQKLSHSNIVHYRGSGAMQFEGQCQTFLAQECIEGGSLRSLLLQQGLQVGKRLYSIAQAHKWMLDIANGMKYLHNSKPMVIHRDLKLENILLNKQSNKTKAIIADFGLHSIIDKTEQPNESFFKLTGKTGSYVYMAPEVFLKKPYNEKVDVYSFAIIMWEIFSYKMLLHDISRAGTFQEVVNFASNAALGQRPPIPESWPPNLQTLITNCWQADSNERPSFKEIVTELVNMKDDVLEWDTSIQQRQRRCTIM